MYRLSQERADLAPVWEYKGSSFGDWLKLLDRNELRLIRKIGLYEYLARKVGWHLNLDGSEELEDLITAIENLGLV
jgi:hypothetical protein